MRELTPKEMLEKILSHTDNYEPITREWLMSVVMLPGDETSPPEYEATIQVIDTRSNTQLHESYGESWEECTVLGYNENTKEIYIETYGGDVPMSTQVQDTIILRQVEFRIELRILLAAHKAWGYRGE